MIDVVAHRGPNGEGHLLLDVTSRKVTVRRGHATVDQPRSPFLYLGHRRLAILDLSEAGVQPMGTPDGQLFIALNGEIYNYVELREQLRAEGHRFVTGTDTEVALHAYKQWGEECFPRFNGMWALAILDVAEERLVLCVDRFGVKPLHHATGTGFVAFGSEIKQLLPFVGPTRANESAVAEFIATGVTHRGEATCFDRVQRMTPGQLFTFNLRTGERRSRAWYVLPYNPEYGSDDPVSFARASERFREAFVSAVTIRMRSDVPVGSCLSGGLDSSAIVGVASKLASASGAPKLHTFTSCWDDPNLDEWAYASTVAVANRCTAHRVFPSWGQFQAELDALLWHQEEPFGSASVFAQWAVMRLARANGIPVLLDGQGSDELMGGYHSNIPLHLRDAIISSPLAGMRKALGMRAAGYSFGLKAVARAIYPAAATALYRYRSRQAGARSDTGPSAPADLAAALRDEFTRGPLQTLLRFEDRNSMAFSIESRCPFMDYRLVEYVFSLPRALLTHGAVLKPLLRSSMSDVLPSKVANRIGKLGFAAPNFSIDGVAPIERVSALEWRRRIVCRWRRRFGIPPAEGRNTRSVLAWM